MKNREQFVTDLGKVLARGVRVSITRGAQYEPGEHISANADDAWHQIAEALVTMVERIVDERAGGDVATKP